MTLSGKASQLKVHLHDDSGHNESYLWKILTIGQFTTAAMEPTTAGQTTGTGPDATLPVRNYLFRNAERWLAEVGFIDTIDLKSGTATATNPNGGTIGSFSRIRLIATGHAAPDAQICRGSSLIRSLVARPHPA